MRKYTAELLDQEGKPLVFLENANNIVMQGFRLNQPNTPAFVFPLDDPKIDELRLATRFRIYRESQLLYSGKILKRSADDNKGIMKLKGITNESELEDMFVPDNWSHLNGRDLADAVRYLLKDWEIVRINTYDDWRNRIVYSENLDGIDPNPQENTDPGKLFIDRKRVMYHVPELEEERLVDQFHPHALARIRKSVPAEVTEVEVLRLAQVVGEAKDEDEKTEGTYIEFRYRLSKDGGVTWAIDWSEWYGKNSVSDYPAKEGFPIPITGLIPDENNIIEIDVKLVTENTTAPALDWEDLQPEDINTLGITPELHGIEIIFRKPGLVSEGDIPTSTGVTVEGFDELNRENHLNVIEQLCEEYIHEFRVNDDFTVDLAEKFGTVHQAPFIDGVNCFITDLSDELKIKNVIHCYGAGEGPAQLYTTVKDNDSIERHKRKYPDHFEDTSIDNLDDLIAAGEKELQPDPPQRFRIKIPYGSDLPFINRGDTIPLLIPKAELEITGRVIEWTGGEPEKGEVIEVSLDQPQPNIMDHIIKPKKLRRNTRKIDPPVARAKGGFWNVRVWWSGNADHYLVQRTQTPDIESSWRNTGGQIRGKTHFISVPLYEKIYLRVAGVKDNKVSGWSNIVCAWSTPFQTFVDETGKVILDLKKKYLNGLHIKDKLGETVLDTDAKRLKGVTLTDLLNQTILNPQTKIININKVADKDGRIVLNTATNEIFGVDLRDLGGNPVIDVENKEAFDLHLKDSQNNTILNPVDKKLKGVSVVDAEGNEVVNPITQIIKAKKLFDTTGNEMINADERKIKGLVFADAAGNEIIDPVERKANMSLKKSTGKVVFDPENETMADSIVGTNHLKLNSISQNVNYITATNPVYTESTNFAPIPGVELTFNLEEDALVFAYADIDCEATFGETSAAGLVQFRLDGSVLGYYKTWGVYSDHVSTIHGVVSLARVLPLSAGEHTLNAEYAVYHGTRFFTVWNRTLGALILKR